MYLYQVLAYNEAACVDHKLLHKRTWSVNHVQYYTAYLAAIFYNSNRYAIDHGSNMLFVTVPFCGVRIHSVQRRKFSSKFPEETRTNKKPGSEVVV